MNYINQQSAKNDLRLLANQHKQSILIEGTVGCGKTYLASVYSKFLEIPDFQIIEPKVQSIREVIDACYRDTTPIVLCIENLDLGVMAASYTLLKFIEEPLPNIYIVITCRNLKNIPDTIISRSAVVTVCPPTHNDLVDYAKSTDEVMFDYVKNTKIWDCIKTFNDIDILLHLNSEQLSYLNSLSSKFKSTESISNLIWMIQKFPDGSDTPINLVLRYLMQLINTSYIWNIGFRCIEDLNSGKLSTNAVLGKFLFEFKYGG